MTNVRTEASVPNTGPAALGWFTRNARPDVGPHRCALRPSAAAAGNLATQDSLSACTSQGVSRPFLR